MKLFWDVDETLIHSRAYIHEKYKHTFIVDVYDELYYTCVRPCAKQVIEYSREVFGADNVYILTAASELYAQRINKLAQWNFPEDHIIGRETTERYCINIPSLYGSSTLVTDHPLANKNNLLIDNLRPEWNTEKTSLMLINPQKNYLTVGDYYGNNLEDDIFRDKVKHFIDDALNRYADNLIKEKEQQ
jgi:hypothetical protein